MKSIIVTGGAGFIGSHLCDRLLKEGDKVICIDNFVTGQKKNIEHLLSNKNFSLIEQNIITEPLKIEGPVDQIYNLASRAFPKDFPLFPIEILMVGSIGMKNVLNLAVEKKARILQTSTSEVYGNPLQHPQKESYWGNVNPIGERSCYDEGKRFAEALMMAYNRKKNVETRIVRIFNTYGPRMSRDEERAPPNFICKALANEKIPINGDGEQTRSFCFISDMITGLIKLMNSDYDKPINLGNPKEITILDLAEKILRMTNSKSELVPNPPRSDDPKMRKPDISLAKRELNWEPKISLDEGLKKTIAFFREQTSKQIPTINTLRS